MGKNPAGSGQAGLARAMLREPVWTDAGPGDRLQPSGSAAVPPAGRETGPAGSPGDPAMAQKPEFPLVALALGRDCFHWNACAMRRPKGRIRGQAHPAGGRLAGFYRQDPEFAVRQASMGTRNRRGPSPPPAMSTRRSRVRGDGPIEGTLTAASVLRFDATGRPSAIDRHRQRQQRSPSWGTSPAHRRRLDYCTPS